MIVKIRKRVSVYTFIEERFDIIRIIEMDNGSIMLTKRNEAIPIILDIEEILYFPEIVIMRE